MEYGTEFYIANWFYITIFNEILLDIRKIKMHILEPGFALAKWPKVSDNLTGSILFLYYELSVSYKKFFCILESMARF